MPLEKERPDYTYGDLFTWEEDHEDVHRGFATQFSELHYHNLHIDYHNRIWCNYLMNNSHNFQTQYLQYILEDICSIHHLTDIHLNN